MVLWLKTRRKGSRLLRSLPKGLEKVGVYPFLTTKRAGEEEGVAQVKKKAGIRLLSLLPNRKQGTQLRCPISVVTRLLV